MFIWPINYFWLLKFLRQIMQVNNSSHDVNSNVLLNFLICFKGLLAVLKYLLPHLSFWVCSWTDFHVLNNLLLVYNVGMAEWARMVRSFRQISRAAFITSFELFSITRLTRAQKYKLCWSCCFQPKVDVEVLGEASTHSWASTSWGNPRIPQFCLFFQPSC